MNISKIAVVKVRTEHDLEWHLPDLADRFLGLMRWKETRQHLKSCDGLPFMPQMTLPYLAAIGRQADGLTGREHRWEIVDDREEALVTRTWDCDMAWLTVSTPSAPATYRMADHLRALGIKVVLGGIHVTMVPDEAERHADALAMGEGEDTVPAILEDFDAGTGLRARYDGGHDRPLTGLATPAWDLGVTIIGRDGQDHVHDYAPWIVPIQTSRGCRNACHFCSTTRFQGAQRRHRPVEEIVAEIKMLQAQGVLTPDKTVFFTDNNIVSDSDHRRNVRDTTYARQLFSALIPLGITWTGQGEVTIGEDEDLTSLMAESGCQLLLVGLETVKDDGLRGLGKNGFVTESYAHSLDTLHAHGIANIGCFIVGLDGQGFEAFEATKRFINAYVDVPQISLLTPFPGTALHRSMSRQGRILSNDWSRYDLTHAVLRPQGMSAGDLFAAYTDLVNQVYSWPAMIFRALRYANGPRVHSLTRMSFRLRAMSILAPNMVYRRLSKIGHDQKSAYALEAPWPIRARGIPSGSAGMTAGWARKVQIV